MTSNGAVGVTFVLGVMFAMGVIALAISLTEWLGSESATEDYEGDDE